MRRSSLVRSMLPFALAALSPIAARSQVTQRFGVMIPMRDGARLAADMWMPEAPGKYPVLLARTPYMRTGLDLAQWGRYFASRGYVVVVQDTRGRGDSEGTFEFFAGDGKDGYDTIEWLAKRPWSNGKIGTFGLSYLGTVQWLAAREHPPHLVCMAPTAPGGRWFEEIPYQGGAFHHEWALNWTSGSSVGRITQGNQEGIDFDKVLAHRPILSSDSVLGRTIPTYRSWLLHPTKDAFWGRIQFTPADFAKIDIPTMTTTGWFDGDQPGSMFYWRGLMKNAPHKEKHFLVAGPWEHGETFMGGKPKVGEMEFGGDYAIDNKAVHEKFFDWCLKGSGTYDTPRAKVFVTGANAWRTFDAYPPASMSPKRLYLTSGGNANTSSGDGKLTWDAPAESPPDKFTYDPKSPVPQRSAEVMARDRRQLQTRSDVLVYSSEALTEPVEIIGDVSVTLSAASDARDTDFTAVLSDVGPDGRAINLGPAIGVIRARYRHGFAKEELLTPGKTETYSIVLYDVAHRFLPGHRIRLDVSSSAAPLFNPNQNTGNPVATDTEWKVAHQTIYHDRARASAVVLPVVSGVIP